MLYSFDISTSELQTVGISECCSHVTVVVLALIKKGRGGVLITSPLSSCGLSKIDIVFVRASSYRLEYFVVKTVE